jgi:hypothetical protein
LEEKLIRSWNTERQDHDDAHTESACLLSNEGTISSSVLKTVSDILIFMRHHNWSFAVGLMAVLLLAQAASAAQRKTARPKPKATPAPREQKTQAKPVDELARLREEYIKATNDYKASLEKLRASYEKGLPRAAEKVAQSKELFTQGLLSKRELEVSERALAELNDKIAEVNGRMASANSQIADTLLEAEAEKTLSKLKPIPRGGLVSSAAMIRYNGGSGWGLSDAWKVQRFFQDTFKKPLPVAVFGQGSIHDRWRLDHRNSMDVSLHPDGPEGQGLLNFLRSNGIPFLAFRQAIPGTATGPHIHIGRPSHRY